jgi:hypothetical protein
VNPLITLGFAVAGVGLLAKWLPEEYEDWPIYAGIAIVILTVIFSGVKLKLPKME